MDGVKYSHRGEGCTFDTLIKEFKLQSDALERLAAVIRAADTNKPELSGHAAGLLAISIGLSKQYKDDLNQLKAGMGIYDALYRWARDGVNETHDCANDKGDAT